MIGVRLLGRLGNQMFQYAFAKSTAKQLKTTFFIDELIELFILPRYFEIKGGSFFFLQRDLFSIKGYKNLFSFYLKNFFYTNFSKFRFKQLIHFPMNATYQSVSDNVRNNTLMEGYFQSPLFFKSLDLEIKQEFAIKKTFKEQYEKKYKALFAGKTVIAVHIRRGDYTRWADMEFGSRDLSLPVNYYHYLINTVKSENSIVVFMSDDIPFVEKEFGHLPNILISKDSEIMDFQHLLNANICILSNSTFSWWGAYLNYHSNCKVYAPKYFLGLHLKRESPPDIYPEGWIQVDPFVNKEGL